MEVENGVLEDVWLVSKRAIFHFHDYGRKGKTFETNDVRGGTMVVNDIFFLGLVLHLS